MNDIEKIWDCIKVLKKDLFAISYQSYYVTDKHMPYQKITASPTFVSSTTLHLLPKYLLDLLQKSFCHRGHREKESFKGLSSNISVCSVVTYARGQLSNYRS